MAVGPKPQALSPVSALPQADGRDNTAHATASVEARGDPSVARLLVLMTVPVVWGTYAPAVRYIYEQPQPIPGLLFSSLYYVVALASLSVVTALSGANARLTAGATEEQLAGDTPETPGLVWLAGAELGGYLFLGNIAQVLGLQYTTADRAAFLVQLTTIMVPVVEGIVQRRNLPSKTWLACLTATVGVAVLSSDGLEQASSLKGDALVTLSALFYTGHVLRLGEFAPQTAPLKLALSKASWETAYSALSVGALLCLSSVWAQGDARLLPLASTPVGGGLIRAASDVSGFLANINTLPAAEVTAILTAGVWCGAVTCAYTIWAQSFGQRDVRPANANLIYTTQPVFSAIFAAALLDERLSAKGWAGGAIIGAALAISLVGDSESDDQPPPPPPPAAAADSTPVHFALVSAAAEAPRPGEG